MCVDCVAARERAACRMVGSRAAPPVWSVRHTSPLQHVRYISLYLNESKVHMYQYCGYGTWRIRLYLPNPEDSDTC